MITMNFLPGLPAFSQLVKTPPGSKKPPIWVDLQRLGYCIYYALQDLPSLSPELALRQYVIMPDHLHLIIEILRHSDRALGDHLAVFKRRAFAHADSRGLLADGCRSLFVPGFNDQFLRSGRSLDVLYQYIKNNPADLWTRRENPDFFRRLVNVDIAGTKCNLYGNIHLLHNPFIYPVVIHRRDTGAILEAKKELWRYALANGGVLAGAFIADTEKFIFRGAAAYGGKLILISNHSFAKREKPSKALRDLCSRGQLLIISPEMPFAPSPKGISRQECLFLNAFAHKIAKKR